MLQVVNLKPFDGTGFSNWEYRLKLVLEQNGSPEALEKVSEEAEFKRKDAKARNTIVQWLADNVLEVVKNKKTAKEMYETLRNTYIKKGLSIQVELQRKLRNMKFDGTHLSDFIMEFERTVSDLRNCGAILQDSEIISQLLAAMPETYQAVVTTMDIIFSQDPQKVDLDFVKNKLLQEEIRQGSAGEQSSSAVFVTNKNNYREHRGRGNLRKYWKNPKQNPSSSTGFGEFRFKWEARSQTV